MLYSTIEIRPSLSSKTGWTVVNYDLDGQRENSPAKPNSIGFYHYKRSLGPDKAFKELQQCMIEAHLETIRKSTLAIQQLASLELPK